MIVSSKQTLKEFLVKNMIDYIFESSGVVVWTINIPGIIFWLGLNTSLH